MFLVPLMTMLTTAIKETFDGDYPVEDFRDLRVGIEFPTEPADYPGIWVDFSTTGATEIAGIDHKEYVEGPPGTFREVRRWRFAGTITMTVVAFSSLQRHRLADEVIRVIAFGDEQAAISEFRNILENNDEIAVNMNFDSVGLRGFSATQGTPWGGTDFIYEATLSTDIIGEYVTDLSTLTLIPLSEIVLHPFAGEVEEDPLPEPGGWI